MAHAVGPAALWHRALPQLVSARSVIITGPTGVGKVGLPVPSDTAPAASRWSGASRTPHRRGSLGCNTCAAATGFDDKIISMYARGMSTREIQGHLRDLYGIDVSPDLISAVTDAVLEEVTEWQNRPLEALYPLKWVSTTIRRARIGSRMACQADERTGNLSEFPRSKAEIQGWFAGIALARSRIRRCRLTVVETHFR